MESGFSKLKSRIDALLTERDCLLIAIDGNCTAGKTTLAGKLAELYDCNVFHMDDFFLRPEQRTPERYAKIGGNVDYERFQEEVLIPLTAGRAFSYRPFDCSIFTLAQPVEVLPKKLNIIEGTYSHHPYFGDPYDLRVFIIVPEEVQRQRILQRPEFLHQRFFEMWIPMEKAYFESFSIREKSEILLSGRIYG